MVGNLGMAGLWAAIAGFLLLFFVVAVAFYIYSAFVLMAIAKKTKTPNEWMAWIPILNIYLMTQIGKTPVWTMWGLLIFLIPLFNYLSGPVTIVLVAYWWWKIAEACKKPGWWGILMVIPIVNLIFMGILAWGK